MSIVATDAPKLKKYTPPEIREVWDEQIGTDDIVHAYSWAAENPKYENGFIGHTYPFMPSYGISTLSDRRVVGDTTLSSFTINNVTGLVANLTAFSQQLHGDIYG